MKHLGPTAIAEHWYIIFFSFALKMPIDLAFTKKCAAVG